MDITQTPTARKDRREANAAIDAHDREHPNESTFEARNTFGRLLWAIRKYDTGQSEQAAPTLKSARHLVTTLSEDETRWVRDRLLPLAHTDNSQACDEVFRLNNRLDLDFVLNVTTKRHPHTPGHAIQNTQ